MSINNKGLSRLDFDEAKDIAKMVGFDMKSCAKKLRSCGPGPKYYENDNSGNLPEKVKSWYKLALQAAEEYEDIKNLTWSSWKKT